LIERTLRGEAVERPPVWAMRQAGRWDPEFKKLRANRTFYEFAENAEVAAQASLLPRRFGVDAIILFYDITTLPVAMGLPFQLVPEHGPVPDRPIRTSSDVQRLDARPDAARFGSVVRMLELVRKELMGALPVLVFAGAPFTVASYCLGIGSRLELARAFAAAQPEVWTALLAKLEVATIHFLSTLAGAGAAAYQLFDSWAGDLTADEYATWAQHYHRNIFATAPQVPSILFVKECPYLEQMTQTGATAISLGVSHDLAMARAAYPHLVFQGNISQELLRDGTPEQVAEATRRCRLAGGGQRHIINLNHGVDPATPVANFEAFVRAAQE
jgi:uroporphyrinogen decarboxylase